MKVLVIRFSSLGDVVLTLPVFRALRAVFPDAKLSALTKDSYADALRQSPDVDTCFTLTKTESLWSLLQRMRAEKFDAILDLHGNLRSRFICALAGAARVVRYSKAAFARRLFVGWRISSLELERHTLDRYLDAVRKLTGVEPRKNLSILVIQTAFLGDAVLTAPLLGALKERFPESTLDVLATPEVADVFRRHPAVATTLIFDKRGQEKSWIARWRLAGSLRKRHYALAIIPHRSLTSALLAKLAGIPRRVGFDASQGRWLLTDSVPFRWGTHDVERNLALLKPVGAVPVEMAWGLRIDPVAAKTIDDRLQASGITVADRLIGINAGSAWATKRWLPEGFAAVADRLAQDLGAKILFIGGAKDRPIVDAILARMKHAALNWAGETSLTELIAAISRCRIFLTNDSGPMHIAVASGIPTVAIFGPTTKELGFFPYGKGHTVIERNLECRPCGLHGADQCPLGHFHCMRQITADEVFTAVRQKWEALA